MGNGLKRAVAAARGVKFMQAVVWIPPIPELWKNAVVMDFEVRPDKVWTLATERNQNEVPGGLSREPREIRKGSGEWVKGEGLLTSEGYAVLAESGHDWTWWNNVGHSGGKLRYNANTVDRREQGVWLLLEYGV